VQEERQGLSPDQQKIYLAIWEKAIDTQMHFNEMSVKARQFGLTFVAAALGLGVVILSRGSDFVLPIPYFGIYLHGVVLLIAASAFAMYAVSLLDLKVYHKMLRGAVTFGEDFEANYMNQIFQLEKGMTQAISHFSRYDDAAVDRKDVRYRYIGEKRRTAEFKVRRFYFVSIWTLGILAFVLFLLTANFGGQHGSVSSVSGSSPISSPIVNPEVKDKGRVDAP
jgi:hypothetical protein